MIQNPSAEQRRESELYSRELDPIARDILAANGPWDAYRIAGTVSGVLLHEIEWLPHGGGVYVAWAALSDVYETGKTPVGDAHGALRRAASSWLDRSGPPSAAHIEHWCRRTEAETSSLFERDGSFWGGPS